MILRSFQAIFLMLLGGVALSLGLEETMPASFQLLFPFLPMITALSAILGIIGWTTRKDFSALSIIASVSGLLLVMVCFGSPVVEGTVTQDQSTLKVLSWNAQQMGNDTNKVNAAVDRIIQIDPDIVLLQEFGLYYKWPDVDAVARDFSEHIGLAHYDFTPHEGNIFGIACFSKYPIQAIDTIFQLLSITNEAKRYSILWEDDTVEVVNAHLMSYNLASKDAPWGLKQWSAAIEKRQTQAQSINDLSFDLCFGDLNSVPGDAVYRSFTNNNMDPYTGTLASTHQRFPLRIDHCFIKEDWGSISAELDAGFHSDHKALITEVYQRN